MRAAPAAILVALLAALWPLFAAADAPAPTVALDAPTPSVALKGKIAEMGWIVGDWTCSIVDDKAVGGAQHDATYHFEPRADGLTISVVGTLDGKPGAQGDLSLDTATNLITLLTEDVSGTQQKWTAKPEELAGKTLVLHGTVTLQGGTAATLRANYDWSVADEFTADFQIQTKDGTWLAFEHQNCKRGISEEPKKGG